MARKALITGAADTPVGRLPEHNCMSLHVAAAQGAITDAGLKPSDIDGVLAAFSFTQPHMMLASVFCEYMGLKPGFTTAVQSGGATACTAVALAAALVEAGMCKHVLVVTGDNRLSGLPPGGAAAMLVESGTGVRTAIRHQHRLLMRWSHSAICTNTVFCRSTLRPLR